MKINFEQELKTLRDKPLRRKGDKDLGEEELVPVTLGFVIVEALLSNLEKGVSGNAKAKRFELAEKIFKAGEVDISTDDIAMIKKLIANDNFQMSNPLIVGQCYKLLEGKNNDPDPDNKQS